MNLKPIPDKEFPNIKDFNIIGIDEPIVSLSEYGLKCNSQYFKQGVPGSYKDCYARETVANMLVEVNKSLPEGYELCIFDGYRPLCIQQRLWNCQRQTIKNMFPNLSDEEIDFKTSFYVSKPTNDINKPFLHNTGGAVDVTLTYKGISLDFGTEFDEFSQKSKTAYFELYRNNRTIRELRELLYWSMLDAGFTNLPSEWWHYDYGTKFWAYEKNCDALYKGILDIDFPNRFPLI